MTTTAASIDPPAPEDVDTTKQYPLNSLVASARRLTSKDLRDNRRKTATAQPWQDDAWDMYDLVGEHHFLSSTLAKRMAQARLYVGRIGANQTDAPERLEEGHPAVEVLDTFGGSASGRSQLLRRLSVNLFIPGDGWLVGVPPGLMPDAQGDTEATVSATHNPFDALDTGDDVALGDLEWMMLSVSEVSATQDGKVTLQVSEGKSGKIECSPDQVYLIRVWQPHPRRAWEADSPTRANLPVLRELVGLTMHISAQVDSRLAGAGLLLVPQSAARALQVAAGIPEDAEQDVFTEALMEAMLTPIGDRSNASAVVPLVVTVPDEAVDKFHHMTFSKPLDSEARTMRDEAIRRYALGADAPPELLLGVAGMNHWGAWLVREDVVNTHIEPPLALICDALTTQFLWPVLEEMGYSEEEYQSLVVWYDVAHLIARPNRAADAALLYDKGLLRGSTVREATGFDESDAPESEEASAEMDEETLRRTAGIKALDLAIANPALITDPGLDQVAQQVYDILAGKYGSKEMPSESAPDTPTTPGTDSTETEESTPSTADDGSPEDSPATAAETETLARDTGISSVLARKRQRNVPVLHSEADASDAASDADVDSDVDNAGGK